jgi:predicted HD phosphohydrolase
MPPKPTLVDFFKLRFTPGTVSHVLQSATRAMKQGHPEETILACLLHDIVFDLIRVDHGWWGAQLVEPYVPEKVSWAIRYHQALRFYPDPSVGYEYPEMYNRLFGKDYVPEPYIEEAYKYALNHKWYMEARLITLNDEYSFDPNAKVSIDPFIDLIGRYFKQPKEGLGYDNSPVAHMWRSLIYPDHPL